VKPHAFHSAAATEYAAAAEYYLAISPELAARFFKDVEFAILRLRKNPEGFRRISPRVRRALCGHFPFAVLFVDEPERIWIVAVMHSKRRPGYWGDRLGSSQG